MLVEILKNPVIIGLLAGAIVYNYMAWNRKKEIEKRLKKGKKIKEEQKYNDIIIPSIVAIIVWFISFAYFNYKEEKTSVVNVQTKLPVQSMPVQTIPVQTIPVQTIPVQSMPPINASPSDIAHSFTMINKTSTGVTMPPDVIV
jgi:hypothetical protein